MNLFCTLAVAVAALVLAAPSQARSTRTTSHLIRTSTTQALHFRRAVVVSKVRRERSPVRWWLRHRRTLEGRVVYRPCRALGTGVPGPICEHGQRLVVALHELRAIDAELGLRLTRARAAAAPAHLAGWECIHGGEGDGWNPSHDYSGPLQMTSGWEGYPISDWDTIPRMQVYADAEAKAAENGFSYSWMAGQWPNTFPRCARFFG